MAFEKALQKIKVKMLTGIAGLPMPHHGLHREFSFVQNESVELAADLAKAWSECGHCEIVKETAKELAK